MRTSSSGVGSGTIIIATVATTNAANAERRSRAERSARAAALSSSHHYPTAAGVNKVDMDRNRRLQSKGKRGVHGARAGTDGEPQEVPEIRSRALHQVRARAAVVRRRRRCSRRSTSSAIAARTRRGARCRLMAYRHVRRIKRIYLDGVERAELPRKSNFLFVGPTGCGKTFLVEMLFGKILQAADRARRHHDLLRDRLRRPGSDRRSSRGCCTPPTRTRCSRRSASSASTSSTRSPVGPEQRDLRRRRHDQGRHRHGRAARAAQDARGRARSSCRST